MYSSHFFNNYSTSDVTVNTEVVLSNAALKRSSKVYFITPPPAPRLTAGETETLEEVTHLSKSAFQT